jgi:hypothetical protein
MSEAIEATLDVLLRVAGLSPPEECRAGIMANLALLSLMLPIFAGLTTRWKTRRS